MFELRILSGLHRGATLPLDERPLLIGADDDADVVLVDPDIATQHARLTPTAHGWSLSSVDGPVLGAGHNRPCASLELQAGDCARLGHVWLTVADAEAPWNNPPALPPPDDGVDEGFDDSVDAGYDADIDDAGVEPGAGEDGGAHSAAEDELYRDSPLDDAPTEPAAQPLAAGPAIPGPPRKIAPRSKWRRSKLLIPLALVTVLSACAAYTLSSGPDPKSPPKSASKTLDAASAARLEGALPDVPAPAPRVQLSQAELREAWRNRLKEVDLLKRFDLDLQDKDWTLHASLDADEAARFERILKAFIEAHHITFPVHAKVGGAETMLPFRIREVVSGSNASVVTQDGNRLYVGDAYRGARLVAVEGRFLQFDGERKIKVKW